MGFWLFLLGFVLGGAIVFGAWMVLPRAWQPGRIGASIFVGLIVGLNVANNVHPTVLVERELLQSAPYGEVLTAFKAAEPDAFAEFVRTYSGALHDGDRSDALEAAMPILVRYAEPHFVNLSDADTVVRYELMRDILRDLKQMSPQTCQRMMVATGQVVELPIHRPLRQRQVDLFARAFRSSPHETAPMSDEEYQAAIADLGARTRAVIGDDIALMVPGAELSAEQQPRYCEVAAEFMNQLSLMPAPSQLAVEMVRRHAMRTAPQQ